MDLLLPYDTETSGIPLYSTPSGHPDQPHLVQLAAILINATTRAAVAHMDVIIKPDGWLIPLDASNVHGITTEKAMELGIPEVDALAMFMDLWHKKGEQCNRIGFNEPFDARIMRIAQMRYPQVVSETLLDDWKVGRSECAMKMARPHCNLPKAPKLIEAYEHFTGMQLPGAHTAMGDTLGAITVYFACMDKKAKGTAQPFTLPVEKFHPNGAPKFSTTTFKENGEPIMLNADGTRSIFCDVADGDEPAAAAAQPATA